jgi:beta-xylosidase/AraC-like DNA-binding protein
MSHFIYVRYGIKQLFMVIFKLVETKNYLSYIKLYEGEKEMFEDYKIQIVKYEHHIIEKSKEVRLFYIVDGICTINAFKQKLELENTDIYLVNANEHIDMKMHKNTMIACIFVDYYLLCNILHMNKAIFYVNSQGEAGYKYTKLVKLVQDLLISYADNSDEDACKEKGLFYLLLDCLKKNFMVKDSENIESNRIQKMMGYIHGNFRENINLNEIADEMFLSVSATSRLFKRETGENFASYVKKLRLEFVKSQLSLSDESITKIALKSGFTTPSAMNKIFRVEVGVTPGEYRKLYSKKIKELSVEQDKKQMYQILLTEKLLHEKEKSGTIRIKVNVADMQLEKKWQNRLLNVGPIYALEGANIQNQVISLVRNLKVEYIRVWNVFSKQLMMYDSVHKKYNYAFIDEILDFCVDNKMKLFIDLRQRKDVALASESEEIYSYENSIIFESEEEWKNVLENVLEHMVRRYGQDIVGQWIFEFSFFLNERPYYVSEDYSSGVVWEQGYKIVKRIIPEAKIAGPGVIPSVDNEFTKMVVKSFLELPNPPDIFTSFHFPYVDVGEVKENYAYKSQLKKIGNKDFLSMQIDWLKNLLKENNYKGQFWITEWGNSLANRNYVQDSCFKGTFIVENVLKNYKKLDVMGIFYASDLINVFLDSNTILSGSNGLISRNGIHKPSYYVYMFLDNMGKHQIMHMDNCIITAEDEGDIRILCCNNKALGPKYFLTQENSYKPQDLKKIYVNRESKSLEIELQFIENHTYTIRQNILNEEKGSILDKWIAFGCDQELSREDIEYLKQTAVPEIISEKKKTINGSLRLGMKLEPNEIRMIMIRKDGK